jgi:DNA-binding transcriptional LysR family regulator
MVNLNELVVFLAAAESGNFSAAGRQLHLSQPAVSQNTENLERRFNTRLFARQGRSVRLTEAGQVLEPAARELLATARRLEETMASIQGEVVGELTIGCSTASGKYLLPGLIARFRRSFPQVRVNVLVHSRSTVLNRLVAGELSLGVSSKRIEHRELEYQHFYTDEVVLIVPACHPWARSSRLYPDDLLEEALVLREASSGTWDVLADGLQRHDISPDMLKVAMVLGSTEAICLAVEEGAGAAFVSRLAAARGLECGRVVEVKVEGMRLAQELYLARSRRIPASRAQEQFWEFAGTAAAGVERPWAPLSSP